jgi:N-acetylmuramoyl-L-alanine amidase
MRRAVCAGLVAFTTFPVVTSAGQTVVHGARIWSAPDHTRIVLDTAAPIRHNIFTLNNPSRIVIDLTDASLNGGLPDANSQDLLVAKLRSGVRDGDDLRLVMDLKQPAKIKSFELEPNDTYGHRLVIDLSPKDSGPKSPGTKFPETKSLDKGRASPSQVDGAAVLAAATASAVPSSARARQAPELLSVQPKGGRQRDVVIAVDAGHGGEDPGALGRSGTREKDVTLAIARKLAALINKQRGMKAVLIRDGDYFVPLRQRIAKARKYNADLFVSIHADAFKDPNVRGSSVYTLSNGGATSEAAKWLAARENSADLIGGVSLKEKNDLLASVLLDMSMNATIEHSSIAATRVLAKLRSLGDVHQTHVQQAGFVVLKSPDIPSMLVETAFISNPQEEKRLRSGGYQNKLANSLLEGILDYFRAYPPPGTRFARQSGAGDSTSDARDYGFGSGETVARIAGGDDLPMVSGG